jgi:hypothetical protein
MLTHSGITVEPRRIGPPDKAAEGYEYKISINKLLTKAEAEWVIDKLVGKE